MVMTRYMFQLHPHGSGTVLHTRPIWLHLIQQPDEVDSITPLLSFHNLQRPPTTLDSTLGLHHSKLHFLPWFHIKICHTVRTLSSEYDEGQGHLQTPISNPPSPAASEAVFTLRELKGLLWVRDLWSTAWLCQGQMYLESKGKPQLDCFSFFFLVKV